MRQEKILFLGAAPTQIPPIQYAKNKGYYVITCDYLPENPGHKLADEWHNISTTDENAVLQLAQELNIDGIVAYASDPAAPTAAYVSEKIGLNGNPYSAVMTLARKDLFRQFLATNGFNVPKSKSFSSLNEAKAWLETIGLPAFIKPVDSSGSKGVTKINHTNELSQAFKHALEFSRCKSVVVEQAIERVGYQVDSDIFMVDGKVAFWVWGDQHQDKCCHPYVPVGISFPSILQKNIQEDAISEIEKILQTLSYKNGAFNVEFVVDKKGKVWVIEIGPRNGGNLIPEVIKYATGVDMVEMTVESALGHKIPLPIKSQELGFWSSYIVHARQEGCYKRTQISERAKKCIVESEIRVKEGDFVNKFSGSHDTLGTMIMRFDSEKEMLEMLDNMENDILVETA